MISILMAVYINDKPEYLTESLESIYQQKSDFLELVLVNDGQITIELQNIINEFSQKMSINNLQLEDNKGLASALNYGLKHAKGEFIARMDSDDICMADRFEIQKRFLLINKDIDVVGSSILEFSSNRENLVEYPQEHSELFNLFRMRDPVAHPAVMFRKDFVKSISGYNEAMMKDQDTELWYRVFMHGGKFANIKEPLLKFRLSSDTLNRRSSFQRLRSYFLLRAKIRHDLNYSYTSLAYVFCYCILQILPVTLKSFIYRNFR